MTENQKKWLLDLQGKGVMFEYSNMTGAWVKDKEWAFTAAQKCYCIPDQPIPDIPDWRELCWEMQSKGVRFKMLWGSMWSEGHYDFENERDRYQILQQPIPEWREEMTEETKPDQREEIPHREQQIQWHEDMLHHLRTREPMREWEYRLKNGDGEWKMCHDPHFSEKYEYRRKPRTVKYWHCVARAIIDEDEGRSNVVLWSTTSMDDMEREINIMKETDSAANFGPIIEATLEIAD